MSLTSPRSARDGLVRALAWIAPASGTPLDVWRHRILAAVLLGMSGLGLFAYLPSIWLAWGQGERTVVLVDTIAYGCLVLVLFGRWLPYAVRASVVVVLPAALGLYFLAGFGFLASGFIWFMAFPIMGAVLLGLRMGIACLATLTLSLIVFGRLLALGAFPWAEDVPNALVMWTVSSISVVMLCSLITLSVGVLFDGLGNEAMARQAAERESALLAGAVDQSDGLALLVDTSGTITYANSTARQLAGDRLRFPSLPQWDMLLAGTAWAGSFECPSDGDESITLSGTMSPVRDEQGRVTHVLATLRDIRRERALEARLQQGQKLEAIGTLAGGIAHDFNNLLQPIVLNTESVQSQLPPDDTAQPLLGDIRQAAERARALVRRILTFTRAMEHERRPVDLTALLQETERLLRTTLPANITVRVTGAPDVMVFGEPGEVQQVLLNLSTNATHAMPGGGDLHLDVSIVSAAGDAMLTTAFPAEDLVACLSVTDTGSGMSADTLARAFDPFFTTKGPGRGTGLGLAMVHGTVTALGGIIVPRSVQGLGTSMRVFLPLARSVPAPAIPVDASSPADRRHRVFVVDDEPAVLTATMRLLARLGRDVDGCTDPAEALARLSADADMADCVITDLSMPGMNGLELARALHARHATLPIILITGYLEHEELARSPESGIVHVLPKPFSSHDMQQALGLALPGRVAV